MAYGSPPSSVIVPCLVSSRAGRDGSVPSPVFDFTYQGGRLSTVHCDLVHIAKHKAKANAKAKAQAKAKYKPRAKAEAKVKAKAHAEAKGKANAKAKAKPKANAKAKAKAVLLSIYLNQKTTLKTH